MNNDMKGIFMIRFHKKNIFETIDYIRSPES